MIVDAEFELMPSNLDGYYVGRVEVGTNSPQGDVFLCTAVYFNIYRI